MFVSLATRRLIKVVLPLALTVTYFSFAGCASPQSESAGAPASAAQLRDPLRANDESPVDVIDVHTHADFEGGPEETSHIPQTREEYLRELKEAHVVATVTLGDADGKFDEAMATVDAVHCGGIGKKVDMPRIEKGLRSGLYHCIKIYLGYAHRPASDALYQPAYKLAEKYDVPVVFHTGDTYDTKGKLKYSDPLTLDEVAVDHPKMNMVIAQCGNPWFASAAEVAYKNPNVYLECSALMIGDLKSKPAGDLKKYVIDPISWIFGYVENPKKMMFGTDWPLVNIKDYLDVYKQAIPREHWNAVFHDNAVRVFKIKTPPKVSSTN